MEEFEHMPGNSRFAKHATHRFYLLVFAFLLIASASSGCSQPDIIPQPTPDIVVEEIVVKETAIATETVSPIPTATSTPSPLPTPTPQSAKDIFVNSGGRSLHMLPACQQENESFVCYDNILHISFAYPDDWGELGASLTGGQDGYTYGWIFFSTDEPAGRTDIGAGGRSADYYGPGRGRTLGDFWGFTYSSPVQCTFQIPHSLCHAAKPGVVVRLYFPIAEDHCRPPGPGGWFQGSSTGAVFINLLEPTLINGLVLISPIPWLDEVVTTELTCTTEDQKEFDARIEELIEQVRTGTASPEIMDRVNELYRLAESIEGIGVGE